jgi:hypothetical protein
MPRFARPTAALNGKIDKSIAEKRVLMLTIAGVIVVNVVALVLKSH